jgi:hypothetical protein
VVQEVSDFQGESQFQVIALGVQADIERGAGGGVPPVLTAFAHPAVADNPNGLRQAGDAVDTADCVEGHVYGFSNAGTDGAKPVSNGKEFFNH